MKRVFLAILMTLTMWVVVGMVISLSLPLFEIRNPEGVGRAISPLVFFLFALPAGIVTYIRSGPKKDSSTKTS